MAALPHLSYSCRPDPTPESNALDSRAALFPFPDRNHSGPFVVIQIAITPIE